MTGTTVTDSRYCGRFAPSPTGPLHAGSLFAAVASYLDARAARGRWLVRIDDIDPPREQPGAADAILRTLEAHGLTWDGPVVYQRHRFGEYDAVADRLLDAGRAFYCQCSRRHLRAQNEAAQRRSDSYPGTCRDRNHGSGALRFRVDDRSITIEDRLQSPLTVRLDSDCGDFIIRRRDGLPAYQLAVAVDDAEAGVTDVVRGVDLYDSTPRQVALQQALGYPTPRYAHLPVLVDAAGTKLSKQTGAEGVARKGPANRLIRILAALGQEPPAELAEAAPEALLGWASEHWRIAPLRGRRTVDAASVAAQQNPVRS